MKRRKKGRQFKVRAYRRQQSHSSRPPTIEIEPEVFADYIRQAEREVLPLIRDMQLGPGAAQLVLALHAQMLITGDPRITPESMMAVGNSVIALWQTGYYTPRPEYPFTLEETLLDVQEGPKAKANHAASFQRFTPADGATARGLGTVHGGIAKHPETQFWQVWMMVDGPCTFMAAYRDPMKAQRHLESIISTSRKGGSEKERAALYAHLQAQAEGQPKQLPYDMMLYLVDHLDDFTIAL
ncbi:MAG TPA: hypothetical protein VIZ18_08520 [Ktedonobacteraceae bacterium]